MNLVEYMTILSPTMIVLAFTLICRQWGQGIIPFEIAVTSELAQMFKHPVLKASVLSIVYATNINHKI